MVLYVSLFNKWMCCCHTLELLRTNIHAMEKLAAPCENQHFAYVETKTHISAFVSATRIVQASTSLIRKFNPLAIFYSCTAWFVSDQVENQNVGFSQRGSNIEKLSMASFVWGLGKQNSPRCDAAKNGIQSWANKISSKNEILIKKYFRCPLK